MINRWARLLLVLTTGVITMTLLNYSKDMNRLDVNQELVLDLEPTFTYYILICFICSIIYADSFVRAFYLFTQDKNSWPICRSEVIKDLDAYLKSNDLDDYDAFGNNTIKKEVIVELWTTAKLYLWYALINMGDLLLFTPPIIIYLCATGILLRLKLLILSIILAFLLFFIYTYPKDTVDFFFCSLCKPFRDDIAFVYLIASYCSASTWIFIVNRKYYYFLLIYTLVYNFLYRVIIIINSTLIHIFKHKAELILSKLKKKTMFDISRYLLTLIAKQCFSILKKLHNNKIILNKKIRYNLVLLDKHRSIIRRRNIVWISLKINKHVYRPTINLIKLLITWLKGFLFFRIITVVFSDILKFCDMLLWLTYFLIVALIITHLYLIN